MTSGKRTMHSSTHFSTRRDFLFAGLGGTLFGWTPWFRPKQVAIADASFRIVYHGRSSRRYLWIHGDEQTAREVLEKHIASHKGRAFLIESQTRDVPIGNGKIDPNRMFSRYGAAANLRSLNPAWTAAEVNQALDELDRGRKKLLHAIFPPDNGLMVALHNNTGYSVLSEKPIGEQMSLREPDNPHAFFLCTDKADFDALAKSPYNVVLEQYVRAPDDGSLSRRAAARQVRYVNLEVRMGEADRQRQMLDWLEAHLA
ncbi:MAG: hypothetical protein ABSH49_15895 [Bryobacteraceae bacterium]|jgi:hypothetical protein